MSNPINALAAATDAMNVAFSRAEEIISASRPGVTVSVRISNNAVLMFGKKSRWGLFIVYDGDPAGPVPINNASRVDRVLAAAKLHELPALIVAESSKQLAEVAAATAAVTAFVAGAASP